MSDSEVEFVFLLGLGVGVCVVFCVLGSLWGLFCLVGLGFFGFFLFGHHFVVV